MNMSLNMKNNRREKMKKNTTRLSVGIGSLLRTVDLKHFMVVFLKKKNQMVKICKINEIFGGQPTLYHIHNDTSLKSTWTNIF
jgi:hypothetical protein